MHHEACRSNQFNCTASAAWADVAVICAIHPRMKMTVTITE
jgi:hypothetical protein